METFTTSLGRLFQCVIVLTVKKLFLLSVWNFCWCNLYLLPFVFSMWLLMKQEPPSSFNRPLSTRILWWGPPEPSFLQDEETQWLNKTPLQIFINTATEREESKMAFRKVKDKNSSQFLFYFWRTWRRIGHRILLLTCGLSRMQVINKLRWSIGSLP